MNIRESKSTAAKRLVLLAADDLARAFRSLADYIKAHRWMYVVGGVLYAIELVGIVRSN
jgi:hypothetical protein